MPLVNTPRAVPRGRALRLVRAGLVSLAFAGCARGAAPGTADAPAPAREAYVDAGSGIRLFTRVVGAGPDTIVAIHGGPGVDLESIYADFLPLAARHVVIFYDQRGTGRSTLPRDTAQLGAATQVADLDAIRAHFRLGPMTLVAHSYGPLLAATYALAHPDRVQRMVFLGPVPPMRGDFWQRFAANVQPRMTPALGAQLQGAMRRLGDPAGDVRQACRDYWESAMVPRLGDPARTRAMVKADLCASDPAGIRYGLLTTNRIVMASYGAWDLRAQLRALTVPVLVVHGEAEAIPMDLVEEWTTSFPNATLVRVPGAAHFAYAEAPEVVWPAVEGFLARTR